MKWMVRFALSAMMPGSETLPAIADLGLREYVDRFFEEATWMFWVGAVISCVAFMFTPVFTVYWPVPAVLLPAKLLDRHAAEMASHRLYALRQAGLMVKMVAGLHWASTPQVRAQFGLPPYSPDPDTWRTS